MTGEGKRDPAAVLRLTQDVIALASQLPGPPSRIRLRDGSCEIEVEWEPQAGVHAAPDVRDDLSDYRSGKHRRLNDGQVEAAPFSLKLAGQKL